MQGFNFAQVLLSDLTILTLESRTLSSKDEKKTRKLVGMLIEILHGEYSDTRDLAVVQLALLGEKVVPYICSYLKKEGELESDLIEYHKINEEKGGWSPELTSFANDFKKKWGCNPSTTSHGETDKRDSEQRRCAVEGALKALSIIGDPKAIPVLQRLPICNYEIRAEMEVIVKGKVPLFEKAGETIERIQSNDTT